jgi:hypothetical protein
MTPTETMTVEQELQGVGQQALLVVPRARSIKITNQVERAAAAEMGRTIATLTADAKEKFDTIKRPLNEARARILAWEHEIVDKLEAAKRYLSSAIGSFDQAQEQARREEERRIQKQLQDKAEEEARQASQEQAISDAVALEAAGDTKGAEAVLNNPVPVPVYVPPVILQSEHVKTVGVASQQTWKFRITDVSLIPREYMVPDEKTIGQIGRAMKEKANIPGIQFYPEGGARFSKA